MSDEREEFDLTKALGEAIDEVAEREGKTREEIGRDLVAGIRELAASRRKFGTMPDEYLPAMDESHPGRGWSP